jgi:hypothetical protein
MAVPNDDVNRRSPIKPVLLAVISFLLGIVTLMWVGIYDEVGRKVGKEYLTLFKESVEREQAEIRDTLSRNQAEVKALADKVDDIKEEMNAGFHDTQKMFYLYAVGGGVENPKRNNGNKNSGGR